MFLFRNSGGPENTRDVPSLLWLEQFRRYDRPDQELCSEVKDILLLYLMFTGGLLVKGVETQQMVLQNCPPLNQNQYADHNQYKQLT